MGFREQVEAWERAYRDYMAAWEHGRAVLSPMSATNTANAARRVVAGVARAGTGAWVAVVVCGRVGVGGRGVRRVGKGLGE
jgi:hypothetical protein